MPSRLSIHIRTYVCMNIGRSFIRSSGRCGATPAGTTKNLTKRRSACQQRDLTTHLGEPPKVRTIIEPKGFFLRALCFTIERATRFAVRAGRYCGRDRFTERATPWSIRRTLELVRPAGCDRDRRDVRPAKTTGPFRCNTIIVLRHL